MSNYYILASLTCVYIQEHRGRVKAIELLFNVLSLAPNTARFEDLVFQEEVPSAFVSPVDSYSALYVECNSFSAAVNFVSRAHYPESAVSHIPMDDRSRLLAVKIEETSWVRLKDGSLGYILAHEDHGRSEPMEVVAEPPLLPPLHYPSGPKQRRLFTYEDIKPLLSDLMFPRLSASEHGTHEIHLKNRRIIEYNGPLLVSHIPHSKLQPVEHPDPFELSLFIEANETWPSLLASFDQHPGLSTDFIDRNFCCDFLTSDRMMKLAEEFAALRIAIGDHVAVVGGHSELHGLEGRVSSVNGDELCVALFATQEVATVLRRELQQVFPPLSLVEVVSGRHRGSRGMILHCEGDNVSLLNEQDNTSVVSNPLNHVCFLTNNFLVHRLGILPEI